MIFPVVMYGCESWTVKKAECQRCFWCFWTVVLEKTLESPLDYKEIQPVHPKGDQSWVLIGRTDVEAVTLILWPPDAKSWLIGKDPDAGKYWGQEEKEMTEDEMVGWHHRLNGHGFGWTPEVGDGQGGLAWCSSWGRKESDMIEQLNWTESRNSKSFEGLLPVYVKKKLLKIEQILTHWSIFVVVQSLSHVRQFVTPGTPACQAFLSITNCLSLLKPKSIKLVMRFNHLVLCVPFCSCLWSFPASGSFRMSWLFTSGGQNILAYIRVWEKKQR